MKLPRWELRHTGNPLDTRVYGGGGGDGGAGEMRAAEEERQRKVQAAVDAINARFGVAGDGSSGPTRAEFTKLTTNGMEFPQQVFDEAGYNKAVAAWKATAGSAGANKLARDAMYGSISDAVRDTALRDLDHQYTTASNRNKFGLARSGLLGGSVDAESGGQLKELYGEGKLKAQQQGMQAAADLRTQDERTRQNLISLAQSGLDTGTAASMASAQMASAADAARGAAAGASVGRLFDDLSQAYVVNQIAKARYPQQSQQPSGYGTNVFGTSRYTGTVGR